ncbi:MAG: GNAT family N-acetyltransferase [Actinomycetes bacterium]
MPSTRTRPPARLALGAYLWLVRQGDVSPEAVYAAVDASREHLEPWMPWASGYRPAHARGFVMHAREAWQADGEYDYAIVARDGSVAGACGLHRRIGEGGLEIGYWVRADLVRRGIASRAAAALTGVAFTLDGIEQVEIHHDEANVASGGVPWRLGFTEVGRAPRAAEAPGCVGIEVVWRITREELTEPESGPPWR